jgi:hypothetical protein
MHSKASARPCRAATLTATAIGLFTLLAAGGAQAYEHVTIRDWRTPIGYQVELEPHLVLGTAPPGPGYGTGAGVGFRGSVVLLPDGFIRRVNDSVALGFGLDIGHYTASWSVDGYRDECLRFETGPNGTRICTETTSNGGSYNYVFVPVVMQWNFWLTERFSAFAEPGIDIYHLGGHGYAISPAGYIGGRVRLADRITLTGRVGYPTLAIGVSFML